MYVTTATERIKDQQIQAHLQPARMMCVTRRRVLLLLVYGISLQQASPFVLPASRSMPSRLLAESSMSKEDIKRELEAYLEKRREINADELAKA